MSELKNELAVLAEEILNDCEIDLIEGEDDFGRDIVAGSAITINGSYIERLCKLAGVDIDSTLIY